MMKHTLFVSFFAFGPLLFGQLDSNSVTVTASRSAILQPDQVVFTVGVGSSLTTSLDDVLAALQGSGITFANFSGVSGNGDFTIIPVPSPIPFPSPQQSAILWSFVLPVPFAKMKDTVAALTALEAGIMRNNNGLTLSFSVQGTQVSAQSQQSQACSVPDLIGAARAKAQQLTDGAGLTLGAILAMSSESSSPVANSSVLNFAGLISSQLTVPQTCALTVKFGLTRF
jgi:hypothetical protein